MRTHILAAAMAVLAAGGARAEGLWRAYDQSFAHAKYIDLTHTVAPGIPVWHGFAPSTFAPTTDPATGKPYTYGKDGFEASHYDLQTDQLGTQLDPPAHWAPEYPSIDELPPTYSLRKLVVISIVPQVRKNRGYQMTVADILAWEQVHGRVPAGAVVFIRSDWSKRWPDPRLAAETQFPGVTLAALKFLHLQRRILFHGHEAVDTDTTPTLEGEAWLMHNGYAQGEGIAHLDQVAETGCLVAFGFPKFKGGTGGYARYIAICPASWKYGDTPGPGDAPLPKSAHPLHWDPKAGARMR
ncbi:MAG TPA: cyclase family protein [Rhizomicrobium sp.]